MTAQGVAVPISLTHRALGQLAGAQRSSVSIAMASLRERGLVTRRKDGTYALCGRPPSGPQPPPEALAASATRASGEA